MIPAAALSIIDSLLKLGVIYVQSLPAPQQTAAAMEIFADVNWWRHAFGLPVFGLAPTPIPLSPHPSVPVAGPAAPPPKESAT